MVLILLGWSTEGIMKLPSIVPSIPHDKPEEVFPHVNIMQEQHATRKRNKDKAHKVKAASAKPRLTLIVHHLPLIPWMANH